MNKEEKEVIETFKRLIEYFNKWNEPYVIEPEDNKYFQTLLKLIEKQQAEIERLKQYENAEWQEFNELVRKDKEIETLKRDFEIVDHECSRLEKEDIKKDLLINMLAEQLTTPVHSKEWVIDYYKREIEK